MFVKSRRTHNIKPILFGNCYLTIVNTWAQILNGIYPILLSREWKVERNERATCVNTWLSFHIPKKGLRVPDKLPSHFSISLGTVCASQWKWKDEKELVQAKTKVCLPTVTTNSGESITIGRKSITTLKTQVDTFLRLC